MPHETLAWNTLLELLDAHEAQDRLTVVECFQTLARLGSEGEVSGLMARFRSCRAGFGEPPPEPNEKMLSILAQFSKVATTPEEQLQVIQVLRAL